LEGAQRTHREFRSSSLHPIRSHLTSSNFPTLPSNSSSIFFI
jgi:hypothetical protein